MNRQMDGRNPYGSRGGYVSSRRSRRSRRDRGMGGDGHYGRRPMRGYAEFAGRYDEMPYMPDYGDMGGDYERGGQSRRGGSRDSGRGDMRGRNDYARGGNRGGSRGGSRGGRRDSGADYADYGDYGYDDYGDYEDYGDDYGWDYGEEKLSNQDLMEWSQDLMGELDHDEKEVFKKERVLQRAKEMGIEFSKYSEMEFYVTFLMCYTDYKKTIGKGNMEYALSLAKEWLDDKDLPVKGSEKLALYYDNIVCAE